MLKVLFPTVYAKGFFYHKNPSSICSRVYRFLFDSSNGCCLGTLDNTKYLKWTSDKKVMSLGWIFIFLFYPKLTLAMQYLMCKIVMHKLDNRHIHYN